jgi:hypothetical protein
MSPGWESNPYQRRLVMTHSIQASQFVAKSALACLNVGALPLVKTLARGSSTTKIDQTHAKSGELARVAHRVCEDGGEVRPTQRQGHGRSASIPLFDPGRSSA